MGKWQPLTNWVASRLIQTDFVTRLIDSRLEDNKNARFLFSGEIPTGALTAVQSFADYTQTELTKMQVSNYAVYRNIMLIARTVASGVLRVQQRDQENEEGWTEVMAHPFERIIESQPNPYMGQLALWEAQTAWLLLKGEAYWLTVKTQGGELTELYPLPADRMAPIPHPRRFIDGFVYYPANIDKPVRIDRDRIVYHKLFNPFNLHRGLAPITAFLMSLQINREALATGLESYTKRLSLEHLLSAPPETTDNDMELIFYDLERAQDRGDRYRLIRGGDLKAMPIQKQVEENPDIIYSLTESQINSALGVPDGYWNENSNFASTQEHHASFLENTIWPLMTRLAEDFTVQLVKPTYGQEYRAAFEDIRPRNIETELLQREDARKDQTYGEAREAAGLELHGDDRVNNAPFGVAGEVYRMILEAELTGVIGGGLADSGAIDPDNIAEPENIPEDTVAELEASGEDVPGVGQSEAEVEVDEEKALKAEFTITADMPPEIRQYKEEIENLIDQAEGGDIGPEGFREALEALIGAVFTALFLFGAATNDIDDIDIEGIEEIEAAEEKARSSISALYDDAAGGKFGGDEPVLDKASRIALWVGFAAGLIELGKLFIKGNPFYRWVYGLTEHCEDCRRLNGQVHTATAWRASGWRPKGRNLECGGFNCQCKLVRDDGPSKGNF